MNLSEQTISYLNALYNSSEIVCLYGPHPGYLANSVQVATLVQGLSGVISPIAGSNGVTRSETGSNGVTSPVLAEYITLNPTLNATRAAAFMADYRNFLLEFDSVDLPTQLNLITLLEKVIPIRTVTYSGSKSMHAIISLSDSLITGEAGEIKAELYKQTAQRLIAAATKFLTPHLKEPVSNLIDPSNVDASRLTRLAGAINRHWKNPSKPHTKQSLQRIGALCDSQTLLNFINEYAPATHTNKVVYDVKPIYNGSLEQTLATQTHLKGLKMQLQVPERWAAASNNHHKLIKLTLWLIDATNAPLDEALAYFKKYTYPYMATLGYPEWKVIEAVTGAYLHKRKKIAR